MADSAIWAAAAPATGGVRREAFRFTGTTREYFGIWIVNVLLTILTLGIYSAWAKVRRQRYFYGNTWLAGASFDYHARPMQILIGRIIVLVLLGVYNVTLQIMPAVGALIALALVFCVPWLIMRGLRFGARVTSYRNIRFDFSGTYWGAFQAYILGAMLVYMTAGVLAPLASKWMWRYSLDNLIYGDRPATCDPRLDKLFGQWWMPALVLVGGALTLVAIGIGAFVAFSDSMATLFSSEEGTVPPYIIVVALYFGFVPFIILYAIAGTLYAAGTRNVAFNETIIDGRHMLASWIGRWRYAWISISNIVATIFTLGLARPWAAIRMAKYLALVTALDATGSLEEYFGAVRTEGSAIGAEFMDVEGFDVGF